MKKIMLVLLAMVMLSGCVANSTTPNAWWVKAGATNEQVLKDINGCQVPAYLKEDMSAYESDLMVCVNAEIARMSRAYKVSLLSTTAGTIIGICASGLADRCMATKDYVKNPKYPVKVDKCMEEKGYRWEKEEMRQQKAPQTRHVESTPSETTRPEKPIISTPITPSLGTTRIVTWDFATVKSAPGSKYASIATVRKGDKLTILEQSGEWVRVRLENGQEGWIRGEVLE